MIERLSLVAALTVSLACSPSGALNPSPEPTTLEAPPAIDELPTPAAITLRADDLQLDGELDAFSPSWRLEQIEPGLVLAHLSLSSEQAASIPEFDIRFSTPSVEITGHWTPRIEIDRVTRWGANVTSRATTNAPLLAHYDAGERNRLTVALSDASGRADLSSHVREEDMRLHFRVRLFAEKAPPTDRYELTLRLDGRPLAYQEVLAQVSQWWAAQPGYAPAPVPAPARAPVYSTWYNFHQNLDPAVLLEELKLAKELGYTTIIVDDGWQTTDSARGYAYTGDWQPDGIADFPGFVDQVHALGVDFVLWYSLPFVGKHAKVQPQFEGKYLRYHEDLEAYTLDPRYPEVREHIIATYEQAMKDWGVDGFKIDFIGRFRADASTVLTAEDGRDIATVGGAVDRLMSDLMARLRAIDPEVMIEFRQPYVGPLMRKYGNMYRAADCPNDAVVNRVRTLDLRLLMGESAVHSDMFAWHPDEPVELAALQILNVLFSVPQISVRLGELPQAHLDMVRFWTGYWLDNRELLLDGELVPHGPDSLYPEVRASNEAKSIIALYDAPFVELEGEAGRTLDIINATPQTTVVVRVREGLGMRQQSVYDAQGSLVYEGPRQLSEGLYEFPVPPSGLLRFEAP